MNDAEALWNEKTKTTAARNIFILYILCYWYLQEFFLQLIFLDNFSYCNSVIFINIEPQVLPPKGGEMAIFGRSVIRRILKRVGTKVYR
jgi:hypothetical protein